MPGIVKPLGLIAGAVAAAACTAAMFLAPSDIGRFLAGMTLALLVSSIVASAYAQWRYGRRAARRAARRTLILLAAIAISLAVAEVAVRSVYDGRFVAGDSLLARQSRQSVTLNTLGLREIEPAPTPEPGVYRIAVLGDSITWGAGIERTQRFTERLAESLNASGRSFEVLNFGQRGANLLDHLDLLRNTVLDFQPDFVLLQWAIDDFEGLYEGPPLVYRQLAPSDVLGAWLLRHSALYYLANDAFARAQVAFGLAPSYEEHLDAQFGERNSDASTAANDALDRFVELAVMRRIGVGIVAFPPLVDGVSVAVHTPSDYLMNRVMGACAAYGLTCLDLRGPFNVPEGLQSLRITASADQPNARAHAIAAEAIALMFGEDWRLASLRRFRDAGAGE